MSLKSPAKDQSRKKLRRKSLVDKLYALTATDIGLAIIAVNVMIMGWYGLITGKVFPEGFDLIVGVVFGGKTAHSIVRASRFKSVDNGDHG